MIGLCLSVGLWLAQTPAAPGASPAAEPATVTAEDTDVAEVAIVDGNVVGAKKRALEEAFLHAVDRVFAAELGDAGFVEGAVPDELTKFRATFATSARRYVRSYRVVEEVEANGKLKVRVAAAVDRVFLRRQIEKSRAAVPSATPAAATAPIQIVIAEGTPDLGVAVANALRSSGLNVVTAEPSGPRGEATRVTVKVQVIPPEAVKGAGLVAVRCEATIGFKKPNAWLESSVPRTAEWGFAEQGATATKACVDRLATVASRSLVPVLAESVSPVARKMVTVVLDLVEPLALERFLRKLRAVGAVSRFELRRIAVGVAEVRLETNLAAQAVATTLTQAMADELSVVVTAAAGDRVSLTLRVRVDANAPGVLEEDAVEGQ
ncbi:MAG: hypothetical protein SF187_27410 [Deltaproteobacteria bacterium]|nr:hypothetical protein [Deltaproteobacteria bacterium]